MKTSKLVLQYFVMLCLLSIGYVVGYYSADCETKYLLKEDQNKFMSYDDVEIYIKAKPNDGYRFVKWDDGSKDASRPVYEFPDLLAEPVVEKE